MNHDLIKSRFNPISYWKATGDPFAWANPQFVATEVATTADPVIPPLQATVQVIGWSGFPPISTADRNTLLGALANATGTTTVWECLCCVFVTTMIACLWIACGV